MSAHTASRARAAAVRYELRNETKGATRTVIRLTEAWYGPANTTNWRNGPTPIVEEITVGLDAVGGGTHGEFTVQWIELHMSGASAEVQSVPRIKAFDDSWAVLHFFFGDLLEVLACDAYERNKSRPSGYNPIQPDEFMKLARRLGLRDDTPRDNPYGG